MLNQTTQSSTSLPGTAQTGQTGTTHQTGRTGDGEGGEGEEGDHLFLDGVAMAEATMQATNQRFVKSGVETVNRQEIVETMPQISFVATGVVGFEPSSEPEWSKVALSASRPCAFCDVRWVLMSCFATWCCDSIDLCCAGAYLRVLCVWHLITKQVAAS